MQEVKEKVSTQKRNERRIIKTSRFLLRQKNVKAKDVIGVHINVVLSCFCRDFCSKM